jgi:hypothetical protein
VRDRRVFPVPDAVQDIHIPSSRTPSTLGNAVFMWNWNSFFWPLVVTKPLPYTCMFGLAMLKTELHMAGSGAPRLRHGLHIIPWSFSSQAQ